MTFTITLMQQWTIMMMLRETLRWYWQRRRSTQHEPAVNRSHATNVTSDISFGVQTAHRLPCITAARHAC